jgi:hypothetical protein
MNGPDPLPALRPEVSIYRNDCIALLRRYSCMAVEIGRLPALLGREFFRTNAQDYHVHSFENIAIFVIDVERCLDRLRPFDKELIVRMVLQEYTQEEVAKLLGYSDRQIRNRFHDAIDSLTTVLLDLHLLTLDRRRRSAAPSREGRPVIHIQSCAEESAPVLAGVLARSQLVPAAAELT